MYSLLVMKSNHDTLRQALIINFDISNEIVINSNCVFSSYPTIVYQLKTISLVHYTAEVPIVL